jgi:hypothetical protein
LFLLGGVLLGTVAAGLAVVVGAGWGPRAQRDRKRPPRAGPWGAGLAFGLGLAAGLAAETGVLVAVGAWRGVAIGFSPGHGRTLARVLFFVAPAVAGFALLAGRRLSRRAAPAPRAQAGSGQPPTFTVWVKDPDADTRFLTTLLVRVVQEPTLAFAVSLSQQMCALILRGLGVAGAEADLIAAQASDEIVRKGAFSTAAKPTEASH